MNSHGDREQVGPHTSASHGEVKKLGEREEENMRKKKEKEGWRERGDKEE